MGEKVSLEGIPTVWGDGEGTRRNASGPCDPRDLLRRQRPTFVETHRHTHRHKTPV